MRLARAGLVAVWLVVSLAVVAADQLNPTWDWVELPFSRYVNAEHGWLIRVAVLGAALGAALGIVALRPVWRRRRSVLVLLCIALVALLVAGLMKADPPGHYMNPSSSEVVHGVAGWFGFLSFPPIAWLTAMAVTRYRWPLRALAVVATGLTAFIVLIWVKQFESIRSFPWGEHQSVLGLVERALFFVDVGALALAAHAAGQGEPGSAG